MHKKQQMKYNNINIHYVFYLESNRYIKLEVKKRNIQC